MNIIQEFLQESQGSLTLSPFDKSYYTSLPPDKKNISSHKNLKLFTIKLGKANVGLAGCVVLPNKPTYGYFQIYIDKKFRGNNFICPMAKLVFDELRLREMISTVKKTNIASLKCHSRADCFKRCTQTEEEQLRKTGHLGVDEVRFRYIA
jgi:RimJ/RimL family protein N-acetyltransferase